MAVLRSAEAAGAFFRTLSLNARVHYTSKQYANAADTQSVLSWTRFVVGARYLVDTSDPRVRRNYSRWAEAARTQRQRLFRQMRLDAGELRAREDKREAPGRFFAQAARRSRS